MSHNIHPIVSITGKTVNTSILVVVKFFNRIDLRDTMGMESMWWRQRNCLLSVEALYSIDRR